MTTDIWKYPDTEAVFSPTRTHERIMWLSLDSLAPFWRRFPVFAECLPQARQAARAALEPYQKGETTTPAETRFESALADVVPPSKARGILAFLDSVERIVTSRDVGPWRAFFGQFQHEVSIDGLPGEIVAVLMGQFKEEVVKERRTREAELREAVADVALSEWDLAIHAYYGLNYYSTDQFDKSVVLMGLTQITDGVLFNTFLAQRVTTLSQRNQAALLDAVRQSWAETVVHDPIAAMKGIKVDGEAAAAAIPPATALIEVL